MRGEHRLGVPGEAEGGVDVHRRPVTPVQRGGEQLKAALK